MNKRAWLVFAAATTIFWGVWGALIELPEKAGFPATLGYAVWALTMAPCALVALRVARWHLEHDARSILLGSAVGALGAGGQLLLFLSLRHGPAYLVFPIVSLYPVVTVLLSLWILGERAGNRVWAGIVLSLPAMAMLSWQPPTQSSGRAYLWIPLVMLVFAAWGVQTFVMKFASQRMQAESIFFYMAATAVALIPVALAMTDFSKPIEWGVRGPFLAAGVQLLNSAGALCLVYAVRFGKAIVVVPMTAMAPVFTIVLSLALYHVAPGSVLVTGMGLATVAIYLMAE